MGQSESGLHELSYAAAVSGSTRIPLWIKVAYTVFVAVVVPVYWHKYPLSNFLWFSDIGLLTTTAALWLESSMLASMMALAAAIPDSIWNVNYFGHLVFRLKGTGLAHYMFDPQIELYVRALSLFHVFLPVLLVWLVYRLGYDHRALLAQTILMIVVLSFCFVFTLPAYNVNWVFGPRSVPQHKLPPGLYLGILMAVLFVGVYLPTHLVLWKLFGKRRASSFSA